jgi:hypothetical protein
LVVSRRLVLCIKSLVSRHFQTFFFSSPNRRQDPTILGVLKWTGRNSGFVHSSIIYLLGNPSNKRCCCCCCCCCLTLLSLSSFFFHSHSHQRICPPKHPHTIADQVLVGPERSSSFFVSPMAKTPGRSRAW